jgi:sulfoquinovose isomerase
MNWLDYPHHHAWLAGECARLLDFHATAADPAGGFGRLTDTGALVTGPPAELWITTRMVHCYALGTLLGRPGSAPLVEHGLSALRGMFHDREHGGWFWTAYPDRPADDRKQTYGHAFVLLAAASAATAGFDTRDLLDEVLQVIRGRLADDGRALFVEGYDREFAHSEPYRGQNPNMHLVEAFMAASEATGDAALLDSAASIAADIIGRHAAGAGWRIPEHYSIDWAPDRQFNHDNPRDPLRPYGVTPGHGLEWARLLVQLRGRLGERPETDWMRTAAAGLFDVAIAQGWDATRGGLVYTLDWDGSPFVAERFHWGAAEAIGAAAYLFRATGEKCYADWYRTFWDYTARYLIDPRGGWRHELSPDNRPSATTWPGKSDLYHALQATLFARVPIDVGLATAAATGRVAR